MARNFVNFEYKSSLYDACKTFLDLFNDPAETVIDIGSRDGDDLDLMIRLLGGKAEGVAIEADPISAAVIQSKYKDFTVIAAAATNYNGRTHFTRLVSEYDDIRGASSIYSMKIDPEHEKFLDHVYEGVEQEHIHVPCVRMSTILDSLDKDVIDFVKIDTEGYSGQVLEGFGERLKDIKMLHVETEIQRLHHDHWDHRQVMRFMLDNGFKIVKFYTEWGLDMQDHLYVNTRFIDNDILEDISGYIDRNLIIENRNF